MKLLRRISSSFWPIGILLFLEGILVGANYVSGTWLMGWDNVMPEFHFKQALMTNLFGVWQEHRGLGLYDGMGHAANLVHTIFLWILSLALPANLLRYIFHFLMHFLGGVGAYILLKYLIDKHNATALKLSIGPWIALTGAIFYLFNLATIQMFYTPLEAFSVHFAALPWLGWSLLRYLKEGSRRRFFIFLLISLLTTPQFFIPTLLLPVAILLASISITSLTKIRRICIAAVGFLLINSFWLLPYIYGLPQNAPVIQAAKINQMSSNEVFARNQAFGDLGDVLHLRGFPLDFEDVDAAGTTTYLMAPWRIFLVNPTVAIGSWVMIAIVLIGLGTIGINLIAAAVKKTPITNPVLAGFLLTFFMGLLFLANDTPFLREFTTVLQSRIPFFAEAYRFPFTKFVLLFALSSTILFTFGIAQIAKKIARVQKNIAMTAPWAGVILIIVLAFPAFRGNFISDGLRVTLPDDYPRVFAFMKDKPSGRVAYLPQQQYWSWKYYRWGYRGSGFAWYALSQPIMDRAFDPWSNENENYYWELSRSIYSKDIAAFDAVLAKYDVRYILFDENVISPSHNRALFTEEIKAMLATLPDIKEVARFGKLTVYERLGDDTRDFISLKTNLPTVSPAYRWTDNDVAFGELGDYITKSSVVSRSPRSSSGEAGQSSDKNSIVYPFRSLFTKRSVDEREFTITETPDAITIRSLVEATGASILKADALVYDSTKSADLVAENVKPCGVLRDGTAGAQNLDQFLRFTSRNQRGCLSFGVGNLPHREGYLVAVESRHISGRPLLFSLINQTAKHVELETYLERETSYFILPPLASDGLGYSVYLSNDAIGRQETVNDIKSIKFYRIPYQELVTLRSAQPQGPPLSVEKVDHPNPAYYKIRLKTQDVGRTENQTLILSQSFDPGWVAFTKTNSFPFFAVLKDHVLVNNWENGWTLDKFQITKLNDQKSCVGHCDLDIMIFYLPQLLQWIGFTLLPLPFLLGMFWNNRNS